MRPSEQLDQVSTSYVFHTAQARNLRAKLSVCRVMSIFVIRQCKYYKSTSPWAEMCPRLAVSTESSSPSACRTVSHPPDCQPLLSTLLFTAFWTLEILGAGLKLAPIGTRVRRRSPGWQDRTTNPGGRPPGKHDHTHVVRTNCEE